MNSQEYILNKFEISPQSRFPIKLNCLRTYIPKLFKELGFKKGVEVGVYEGHFSEILGYENTEGQVFSVDPWQTYADYPDYKDQEALDMRYQRARRRLLRYPNITIIKKFSLEASKIFEDYSLDYVYIDANHTFQSTWNDIIIWSKKVKEGGIISGHDYKRMKDGCPTKTFEAVNAYISAARIPTWFLTGENSHSFIWMNKITEDTKSLGTI